MTEIVDVLEGRERWVVVHSESLAALRTMPGCSVDSVVTDPPYGLSGHDESSVRAALACWLSGHPYVHGRLRKGKKNCSGSLCSVPVVTYPENTNADATEEFVAASVLIASGSTVAIRTVQLHYEPGGWEVEVDSKASPRRRENLLMDELHSEFLKSLAGREFCLRPRKSLARCVNTCAGLAHPRSSQFAVLVRLGNDALGKPEGAASVVTSAGAEMTAVLWFGSLGRGPLALLPTEGTGEHQACVELVPTEIVGALPRAGCLTTELESNDVSHVELPTDGALSFRLLIHKSLLDRVICPIVQSSGFMSSSWDSFVPGSELWREVLRVLKPGGHALVFAGARTQDLMGIAARLAGFEVRPTIYSIFGSGMPHGENVSKAIDAHRGTTELRQVIHSYTASGNAGTPTSEKGGTFSVGAENSGPIELTVTSGGCDEAKQWDGWHSNLKPAAEPILVLRKPLDGTIAHNVLTHGCGGINIDANRVPRSWEERDPAWFRSGHTAQPDADKIAAPPGNGIQCHPKGAYPANLVLSHSPECGDRCVAGCPCREIDGQSGVSKSTASVRGGVDGGFMTDRPRSGNYSPFDDSGTASRFFNQFRPHPLDDVTPFIYQSKPSRREKELGCEHLPKVSRGKATKRKDGTAGLDNPRAGSGRTGGARNVHPTAKSVELMRWLVRLVTPPGGVCLDGFCGSGTTGVACILEGFRFIGLEMNDNTDVDSDDYAPFVTISRARISHAASWKPPVVTDKAREPKQRSLFG